MPVPGTIASSRATAPTSFFRAGIGQRLRRRRRRLCGDRNGRQPRSLRRGRRGRVRGVRRCWNRYLFRFTRRPQREHRPGWDSNRPVRSSPASISRFRTVRRSRNSRSCEDASDGLWGRFHLPTGRCGQLDCHRRRQRHHRRQPRARISSTAAATTDNNLARFPRRALSHQRGAIFQQARRRSDRRLFGPRRRSAGRRIRGELCERHQRKADGSRRRRNWDDPRRSTCSPSTPPWDSTGFRLGRDSSRSDRLHRHRTHYRHRQRQRRHPRRHVQPDKNEVDIPSTVARRRRSDRRRRQRHPVRHYRAAIRLHGGAGNDLLLGTSFQSFDRTSATTPRSTRSLAAPEPTHSFWERAARGSTKAETRKPSSWISVAPRATRSSSGR